jgi:hypothetical protein
VRKIHFAVAVSVHIIFRKCFGGKNKNAAKVGRPALWWEWRRGMGNSPAGCFPILAANRQNEE